MLVQVFLFLDGRAGWCGISSNACYTGEEGAYVQTLTKFKWMNWFGVEPQLLHVERELSSLSLEVSWEGPTGRTLVVDTTPYPIWPRDSPGKCG